MQNLLTLPLAVTAGFPWINLVWVLAGITGFLFAVAGVGRWLAATHPDPEPRVRPVSAASGSVASASGIAPATAAAIAAAVHETLGASAQVTAVVPQTAPAVSVENLMLTWSLEGRRQIYSSHKVR